MIYYHIINGKSGRSIDVGSFLVFSLLSMYNMIQQV